MIKKIYYILDGKGKELFKTESEDSAKYMYIKYTKRGVKVIVEREMIVRNRTYL